MKVTYDLHSLRKTEMFSRSFQGAVCVEYLRLIGGIQLEASGKNNSIYKKQTVESLQVLPKQTLRTISRRTTPDLSASTRQMDDSLHLSTLSIHVIIS